MIDAITDILPGFVALILSLSFHEAAHAWAADKLGDSTARQLGRLTLNPLAHIDWIGTVLFPLLAMYSGFPLIGWAKPVPVNIANLRAPRRDFAAVALAGPVSNVILAGAAFLVLWSLLTLLPLEVIRGLIMFVSLNLLLAVFNMLPIPPLDGGNVLAGFVPEPVARGLDAMRPYGIVLVYAVMLYTPVFSYVASYVSRSSVLGWLL